MKKIRNHSTTLSKSWPSPTSLSPKRSLVYARIQSCAWVQY